MGWKQISGRFGFANSGDSANSEQWYADFQQSGDQALLAQLFLRHADALYFFLLRQSNAELAADISQQCWLQLLEKPKQFQGDCSVKTWLFTLARNALCDEFRRQQRWGFAELTETTLHPLSLASTDVDANPAEHLLVAQQQQQCLSRAIRQLPLLQQEALLLQLEGFALVEIAMITHSNSETIKSRLRHARLTLASLMETFV